MRVLIATAILCVSYYTSTVCAFSILPSYSTNKMRVSHYYHSHHLSCISRVTASSMSSMQIVGHSACMTRQYQRETLTILFSTGTTSIHSSDYSDTISNGEVVSDSISSEDREVDRTVAQYRENFSDSFTQCLSISSSNGTRHSLYIPPPDLSTDTEGEGEIQWQTIKQQLSFTGENAGEFVLISDTIAQLRDEESEYVNIPPNTLLLRGKRILHSVTLSLLQRHRERMLVRLLQHDRQRYLAVSEFLISSSRYAITREELPNIQNLPKSPSLSPSTTTTSDTSCTNRGAEQGVMPSSTEGSEVEDEYGLVEDCTLPDKSFNDIPLDVWILSLFRKLVAKEIRYQSSTPGIEGLVEEARWYMLSEEGQQGDGENQQRFVRNVLAGLMNPLYLPPMYRIFMTGMIPSESRNDPLWLVKLTRKLVSLLPDSWSVKEEILSGKKQQFGPFPFAAFMTAGIASHAIRFLVGPIRRNYRKDGLWGGMVVDKCKFLQVGEYVLCYQAFTDSLSLSLMIGIEL